MKPPPDIIASVTLYPTGRGGRKSSTPPRIFRCPLEFDGKKYDCALHLEESGPLSPGTTARVPITVLAPALAKSSLKVGARFTLWEMGTIGEGVIEEVIPTRTTAGR